MLGFHSGALNMRRYFGECIFPMNGFPTKVGPVRFILQVQLNLIAVHLVHTYLGKNNNFVLDLKFSC